MSKFVPITAAVVGLMFLVGCGGGGTPAGVPVTVTLSPSTAQSIDQGTIVNITATVANDSTNQGVTWSVSGAGSLSNQTSTSVTYHAPNSGASNQNASVAATAAASSSSTASLSITVLAPGAQANVQPITIDGGPAPPYPNGVFTRVDVCEPGTATCQTVDGILVDTGSFGLRILESAIPAVSLPVLMDNNNNSLFNCVQFVDLSYLWGKVAAADVKVGGETATSSLVQVVSSSNTGVADGCSNGGTVNENTPDLLGANGILGVGPEPTDCTLAGLNYCDGSFQAAPPVYWACPNGGCAAGDPPVIVAADQQVVNPVVLFPTDNNGVIVDLPALTSTASTVDGTITFGIGTQANNDLGSATVLTLDTSDSFTTNFNGQSLTSSFIDSGSNGFFFPYSFPTCPVNSSFYCPASVTNLSATNTGSNNQQKVVNFAIDNADTLFTNNPSNSAFSTLGGPIGISNIFDFGLPFFYGRSVFTSIDGQAVPAGAPLAPWFAY